MKALSVKQPWAELIVAGVKDVENRSWATDHRGPLLIHATLRPMHRWESCMLSKDCARAADDYFWRVYRDDMRPPVGVPLGCIVGVARLIGCPTRDLSPWWAGVGARAWLLRDPIKFAHPIPWKGRQRLLDVPNDVIVENVRFESDLRVSKRILEFVAEAGGRE